MNNLVWECKTTKYSNDLYTFFAVSVSRSFSPQDIQEEIELFEKYLWDKYYHKEHKESWLEWLTRKIIN